LSTAHAEEIEHKRGIPVSAALAAGVWSATMAKELPADADDYWKRALPAKILPWEQGGPVIHQLAPDDRDAWEKYLFPEGAKIPFKRHRDTGTGLALIVEGFWQGIAASLYDDQAGGIFSMAGINNWSDADLSPFIGRPVIVVTDGDVRTNRAVYDGAAALLETLSLIGADSVRFAKLPAQPKSQGLDDFLAKLPEQARGKALANLLDAAGDLPRPPAKKKGGGSPYFGESGLLVDTLAKELHQRHPLALTAEAKLAVYEGGVYHLDRAMFLSMVAVALGEDNRPSHRAAAEEHLIGLTKGAGMVLPDRLDEPLLNVQNGLVDLRTGELRDHDPAVMSMAQLPVAWNPDATCPEYERWAAEIVGDQLDDLEEVAAQMLDPTRTPEKSLLVYGPARSGKSTYLRLLEEVMGKENRSAVSLHQLSDDKFAAANLYGKKLNTSADLSTAHIEDINVFKKVTGEDTIHGNRKYGNQFEFVNRALLAFSANDLPTVGESSRAYVERIKPFRFGNSFAGRVDPAREDAMRKELEGILVRLVVAWQRRQARGRWLETPADVQAEFERRSNRVRQWVDECCTVWEVDGGVGSVIPVSHTSTKRELYRAFKVWAEAEGSVGMRERKFIDRLTSINGVMEVRRSSDKNVAINVTVNPEGSETPYLSVGSVGFVTPLPMEGVSNGNGKEGLGEVHGQDRPETHTSHTPTGDADLDRYRASDPWETGS
jgi:putative DNA primase/helicase